MSQGTRLFKSGATRDADTGKLDYEGFISPLVDRRFAEYMHMCRTRNVPPGQTLRASDNWQKGIPRAQYAKSLVRHAKELALLHDGFAVFDEKGNALDIETVLCAVRFNVDGYLYEILRRRYPRRSRLSPQSQETIPSAKSPTRASAGRGAAQTARGSARKANRTTAR